MGFKINLLTVVIVLLIVLNIAVFINGLNLSCDKCTVTFRNDKIAGVTTVKELDVNVSTLAESLDSDNCVVTLVKQGGYILNG